MTISDIDICNQALDLLGADPIIAFDSVTKAARLCERNYPLSRDAVLRLYPWNCGMSRKALPQKIPKPDWGWERQFQLPDDCLRVWRVEGGEEWTIESRTILTNYPAPLNIFYIRRIDDPNDMDPLLAEVIAYRLAWKLALNLTESAARAEAVRAQYLQALDEAKQTDAQEGMGANLITDDWINARL